MEDMLEGGETASGHGREGGREKERERSSPLPPGSSEKCSALQSETCPKYFTPPLLYPQLLGSGWIVHREEGAGCAQSSTEAGSFAGRTSRQEHNQKHRGEAIYIPPPASATAQPALLREKNFLFRATASAFNRVLQREITIPQATTATGLESISGWRRSSRRSCGSPVETRTCACVHSTLEQRHGEMAHTSHPAVLSEHKTIPSSPRLCFPSLPSSLCFEGVCANKLRDYEQDYGHGAWSNIRALVLRRGGLTQALEDRL